MANAGAAGHDPAAGLPIRRPLVPPTAHSFVHCRAERMPPRSGWSSRWAPWPAAPAPRPPPQPPSPPPLQRCRRSRRLLPSDPALRRQWPNPLRRGEMWWRCQWQLRPIPRYGWQYPALPVNMRALLALPSHMHIKRCMHRLTLAGRSSVQARRCQPDLSMVWLQEFHTPAHSLRSASEQSLASATDTLEGNCSTGPGVGGQDGAAVASADQRVLSSSLSWWNGGMSDLSCHGHLEGINSTGPAPAAATAPLQTSRCSSFLQTVIMLDLSHCRPWRATTAWDPAAAAATNSSRTCCILNWLWLQV